MKKPCIFNGWNLSHILLFMTLTLFFPEYYAILFVAGFIWECTEYLYGANNWLDILWNSIGITIGLTINHCKKNDTRNQYKNMTIKENKCQQMPNMMKSS